MSIAEKEFINMIEANQGIIHKVCGMYCQQADDKKDLFQEIVIQLWKAYPKFRHDSKYSSWMYKVALNTAITNLRKTYKEPQYEAISEGVISIADHGANEEDEAKVAFLYRAIGRLSEIEKAIVMLYLEDLSNDEIAQIVGITQNNVRVKLHRIQEKIKGFLNQTSYGRA
jgi:RNA polymerase sigma-70 factor (ECF subfamily)